MSLYEFIAVMTFCTTAAAAIGWKLWKGSDTRRDLSKIESQRRRKFYGRR